MLALDNLTQARGLKTPSNPTALVRVRQLRAMHIVAGQVAPTRLVASLANFAIPAAIALALLAELFLVEARQPQLFTFALVRSVFVMAMVRTYSEAIQSKFNCLRERGSG